MIEKKVRQAYEAFKPLLPEEWKTAVVEISRTNKQDLVCLYVEYPDGVYTDRYGHIVKPGVFDTYKKISHILQGERFFECVIRVDNDENIVAEFKL